MGTRENAVQIDESCFSGRRKFRKGNLLSGNISNKKRKRMGIENSSNNDMSKDNENGKGMVS